MITQSGGGLQVFLPLLDRGIDGLIHRLDDGAYLAIQVKTKSVVSHAEAPIALYENHLFTPDQLVIGVFLEGDRLGPYALVVDARTIKRKAGRIDDQGRTPDLPFFIGWTGEPDTHPGARRAAHPSGATDIAWVEIAGAAERFAAWTSDGSVPVRFVDGDAGVVAVALRIPGGELVIR